jgi:predicted DNA-binding protein (UPF0251 family)
LERARANIKNFARGEQLGKSQLTVEAVKDIKLALLSGIKQKDLAKRYGVNQATISHINTGRDWNHVTA